MFKIVLLIGAYIGMILIGLQRFSRVLANDLITLLKKSHLGRLSVEEGSVQCLSVQHFSRDELRLPIDAITLQQMDSCSIIHRYDVSCRIVSCKATFKCSTICLTLSIHFDGELSDGKHVRYEVKNVLITAVVALERHVWQLIKIHPIACQSIK